MADRVQPPVVTAVPADGRAPAAEPQLGDLFRQLAQDSATLVRQEMALAKAELRENVKSVARDTAKIAVGAVLAAVGALVLVLFLVLLLGSALNHYWLGALIVGLLFVAIGGLLAMNAMKRLKHDTITPDQTLQTLKEDKQWLQSEMKQVRRDLA
ncbi:phage holin family protein [Longimicrobium sp.]|uniref:phage holin family protein n=1 Tax=Longimicrobium sp. TaxID=2029185 RepID=UPI002BE1619B|nr:phage holin family protein [Longimicrobium sp.]HSU16034.1 phage holin family protein [Longimicrobium sp.]